MKHAAIFIIACCYAIAATGQHDRVKDRNSIIWPQLNVTIPVNRGFNILAEYQLRRTNGLENWQQSLLRAAVEYKLDPQFAVAVGYGWIETFPYGDFPIAANGTFPEHRIYEQVTYKTAKGKLGIGQRLRIEQRWIARRGTLPENSIESWRFSHRFRYLLRLHHPVTKGGRGYFAFADELFVNAGKNVGANLLDQNRLMLLFGIKFNTAITAEAGYLVQTVVQGQRVDDRVIIQDNQGFILSLHLAL